MPEHSSAHGTFSLTQARHIVKDLFAPNPVIYWADFLLSTIGGMIAFRLVRRDLTPWSIEQGIVYAICVLLFYRATLFTHEMVHMRDKSFRVFRIVWNLLVGIPFLMPSFMYYTHVDHHMRKHFGTDHDGEYLPLANQPWWHIVMYLCQPFVVPVIAVVRFLILAPISWVVPGFRDFLQRRASSMVMDPSYIRPLPTRQTLRIFRMQEVLCFLWTASVATLLSLGILPMGFLYTAYLTSVLILMLNSIRTLGAHRYTSHGHDVSFMDQLLDSVNYPNHPWTGELWAPVGLRFHALHHLFPSLPYHNLGKAHRLLMAELPADSPYRLTVSESLPTSIALLWRTSRANTAGERRVSKPAQRPQLTGGSQVRVGG